MARRGENIYHRKDGRWEGRYIKARRLDGKPNFGYVYGSAYVEVKRKLTVLKAEVNKNPFGVLVYRDGTLEAWCDYWLEILTKPYVDISSYGVYKSQIKNHIVPILGNNIVNQITKDDIQMFINQIKKHLAPGMIHNVCRLLKSIMSSAKERRLIAEVPFTGIKKPRNKQKKPRVLTLNEQKRIEDDSLKNGAMDYLLGLYTGLRLGELCALQWKDIDFESRVLYVEHTIKRVLCEDGTAKTMLVIDAPKTEQSRREIPLPAFLVWKLKEKMQKTGASQNGFVFPSRDGGFTDPRTMQARFKSKLKQLKIRDAHFHTLRHTFATRCLEKHVGLETLSEFLGHSNPQITVKYYSHCTRENKLESINRLTPIAC